MLIKYFGLNKHPCESSFLCAERVWLPGPAESLLNIYLTDRGGRLHIILYIRLNHKVWLIDIIDLFCYIGYSNTFTRIRLFQIKNYKLNVENSNKINRCI